LLCSEGACTVYPLLQASSSHLSVN
jgi:hypothetical protein